MIYKRKNSVQQKASDFALYFDFEEAVPKPEIDPLERIILSCDEWISKGGEVVRYGFGVQSMDCYRDCECEGAHDWKNTKCCGVLHGTYRAIDKACCPIGVILIDTESHFMPMLDAMRILEVSETWGVGFLHGIDNQNVSVIGKNLEKFISDKSYLEGREAARVIAKKYLPEGRPVVV